MKTVTDNQLMKLVSQGDTNAFESLYHRYDNQLRRYCAGILGRNFTWAEDVVQDVWMKVTKNSANYDSTRPLKPWLFRVARNHCFSQLKGSSKRLELVQSRMSDVRESTHLQPKHTDPHMFLVGQIEHGLLQEALDELSVNQQICIKVYLETENYSEELSKILGKNHLAVYQILSRAKKRLKIAVNKIQNKRELSNCEIKDFA
jgi:RNA polymerase sigma-70 factor, ECF subfamily